MFTLRKRPEPAPAATGAAELSAISRSHMVVHFEMDGTIRSVNDAFCEILGYDRAAVVGQPHTAIMRKQDQGLPQVSDLWRDMAQGKIVDRIAPRLNSRGEEVWLDVTFAPVGEAGSYTHVVALAREISEMHLRRRDNRSQVDAVKRSMAVIEFDLTGRILDANELFLKTMGYSLAEIKDQNHRMFMHPEDAAKADYDAFWKRLGAGSSEGGQVRRIDKAGRTRWLQATYETLIDPEARPFKVVKYAFDITDAKNLAADAASQIAAIQRVQAVIEFDMKGHVVSANDTFCETMGYDRSEIIGRHHRQFVAPDHAKSPEYEAFWRDLREGREVSGTFLRIAKGGRPVYLRASYNPIHDASGEIVKVVKYALDTTELQLAVDTMQDGLDRIAAGDLSVRLDRNLGELDAIRQKFNEAIGHVDGVIRQVVQRCTEVHNETGAITGATDELARRTERQAATLEETAAALDQFAGAAKQAATEASGARDRSDQAKTKTEESSRVVGNAVEAMNEISNSSSKISKITDVIDDIAFQTNLLALNAGVEAARAGDAGRGFAVVASEVRALAQRSSEAAREIAELISTSTTHVERGVGLVGQAGEFIGTIDGMVRDISESVARISGSASDQAARIAEMNTAINQLDQTTQRNAAMAEETSAATQTLAAGISEMQGAVSFFAAEAPGKSDRKRLRAVG